ncbi:MAG: biotin--[Prevotella sp.]|nr:biotin--[acetyl-CoA-carboxylase] ligase [Prevotella sp.]
MEAKLIRLDEVDSTNRWMRDYVPPAEEPMTICTADFQTAGQGCGANSWESERGKNLLFSLLIHPENIAARAQFQISMAASLAISDAMADFGIEGIRVKWPNDIYWRDWKLCGILIENRLSGTTIRDSIVGIGVNVNQTEFRFPKAIGHDPKTDPSPVSMRQILGREIERETVLRSIVGHLKLCSCMADYTRMRYNALLYRRNQGAFPFRDKNGEFQAEILEVDELGRLLLKKADGQAAAYAFKEVRFIRE